MTFYKVLIIGKGNWGKRLTNIISSAINIEVENVSARMLIETNSQLENKFDVVWIATRPELQIEIVQSFKNQKIILEKPFKSDFDEKWDSIESELHNTLELSAPGNYSEMWNQFMMNANLKDLKTILIHREGPTIREYMSPVEDWLPHDLALLSECFENYEVEYIEQIETKSQYAQIEIRIKPNFVVIWRGGFNIEKKSEWILEYNDKTVSLDFISQTRIVKKEESICKFDFENDNPIVNLINSVISDRGRKIFHKSKPWFYAVNRSRTSVSESNLNQLRRS